METKSQKGLSFYTTIGRNKGIGIHKDKLSLRLCLWFVSFCVAKIDLEGLIDWVTKTSNSLDAGISDLDAREKRVIEKEKELFEKSNNADKLVKDIENSFEAKKTELEKVYNEKMEALNKDYPGKEDLEKIAQEAKSKVDGLEAQLKEANEEIDSLKIDVDDFSNQADEFEDKNTELEGENVKLKRVYNNITQALLELKKEDEKI